MAWGSQTSIDPSHSGPLGVFNDWSKPGARGPAINDERAELPVVVGTGVGTGVDVGRGVPGSVEAGVESVKIGSARFKAPPDGHTPSGQTGP